MRTWHSPYCLPPRGSPARNWEEATCSQAKAGAAIIMAMRIETDCGEITFFGLLKREGPGHAARELGRSRRPEIWERPPARSTALENGALTCQRIPGCSRHSACLALTSPRPQSL